MRYPLQPHCLKIDLENIKGEFFYETRQKNLAVKFKFKFPAIGLKIYFYGFLRKIRL